MTLSIEIIEKNNLKKDHPTLINSEPFNNIRLLKIKSSNPIGHPMQNLKDEKF